MKDGDRYASLSGERTFCIGRFSISHLGDALCTTPLARQLRQAGYASVTVVDHPSVAAVFANNPHITGTADGGGTPLLWRMRGCGHVIQRLQQGLGLPVSAVPRPEIYLDDAEVSWAANQRRSWPGGEPFCVLSPRVVTDRKFVARVDWLEIGTALSQRYTLVQPIMTEKGTYKAAVGHVGSRPWSTEPVVEGAVVYEDLTLRQYLALFSVADAFCGGTSGGAHAAAAFGVPSLIVVWRKLDVRLPATHAQHQIGPAMFLYPQHRFVCAEDAQIGHADRQLLDAKVEELSRQRPGDSLVDLPPGSDRLRPRPVSELVRTGGRLLAMPGGMIVGRNL